MAEATANYHHVVAIFHDERPNPNKPCRISPAVILAQKGQKILMVNVGGAPVEVQWLSGSPVVEPDPVTIAASAGKQLTIKSDAQIGSYPFEAKCGSDNAEGSRPIIIIYDEASMPR